MKQSPLINYTSTLSPLLVLTPLNQQNLVPPLFINFICQLFQSLWHKTPHSQLVDQKFNSFLAKGFSEDVLGIMYTRLNSISYIVSSVSTCVSTGRRTIRVSTGTGPDWMFNLDFLTNTMNYIPVSVENQDKDFSRRVLFRCTEKPSKNSLKGKDVQDSEDVADKEGQHKFTEAEQTLKDDLEKLVAQEMNAKAMNDATRQAFEEEMRNIASQKRLAQATSINKLSTSRPSVSTATTPYVSTANTSTGANTGESSFVYLGGKIPIDASTLPNADLPIDPNMPDLEDDSDAFPNDGIFNGAYDDDDVGAVANFNNMDNTINVEAMQEELLQFKLQKVWILVDLPSGKKAIGTKWVFKNKKDKRSIIVKNKARLVAQGFRQEEEEVYVHQPPGFVDPAHPNKVYKVVKALYGLHQAPRAWYETLSSFLLENGFRRVLKKFDFWSIRIATTPIESNKPLVKDEDGEDVDVHVYRSMIGSLMYLTASRPDIMYLKHQPKLGLWYPMDSPFELEAFSDSDYRGASLDRKSTTGGCQFFSRRLISWQCKKQTIVANSTTEAEYVVVANCYGQTATVKTLANGIQELVASIDNKEYTIIEASVRSKLQLADAEGINNLPDAKIYDGLGTLSAAEEQVKRIREKIQDIDDDPLVSLVKETMQETDLLLLQKVSASGRHKEEDISLTILKCKNLIKRCSQKAMSTNKGKRYKRRKMSKGKYINTGLDTKEEVNTSGIEVNTCSEEVNTGGQKGSKAPMTTRRVQAPKEQKKAKHKESKPMTKAQPKRLHEYFHQESKHLEVGSIEEAHLLNELKTEFEKLVKSIEHFVLWDLKTE
ncbi:putative ribonuclease H-like domain-containing protein [Tanacetum coccineum]